MDIRIEAYLDESSEFAIAVSKLLTDFRDGEWAMHIPRPGAQDGDSFRPATAGRNAKGLYLVGTDLETFPELPEEGVGRVVITHVIGEQSVNLWAMSGNNYRAEAAPGTMVAAWQVTPSMRGSTPVWQIEVRARSFSGQHSLTCAMQTFEQILRGRSPGGSSSLATSHWLGDPWSDCGLNVPRK